MTIRIIRGDCRQSMRDLIAAGTKVQTCVTSPPYWGLRDYNTASWEGGDTSCEHNARMGDLRFNHPISEKQRPNAGSAGSAGSVCVKCGAARTDSQLGLEPTPQEYVANMVDVFRLVRELLADDGTLWLNLGDSYNAGRSGHGTREGFKQDTNRASNTGADDCRPKDRRHHAVRGPALRHLPACPDRALHPSRRASRGCGTRPLQRGRHYGPGRRSARTRRHPARAESGIRHHG